MAIDITTRDEIRRLLVDGRTNGEIARLVGVTVNVVAGNRARYFDNFPQLRPPRRQGERLPVRPKPQKVNQMKKVLRLKKDPAPLILRRVKTISTARNLGILELKPGHCRWIEGDSGIFCAADAKEPHPYCDKHCMLAYQERKPRDGRRTGRRWV